MAEHTTFSIDVIGRNVCNTFDEATQDPNGIDVVIVGSGMYGGYCAEELYNFSLTNKTFRAQKRQPLRILVLEAGPHVALEHVQNLPDVGLNIPGIEDISSGTNPAVRENVWGQGWRSKTKYTGQAYCVGGKGIYWGGWCPRQNTQFDLIPNWPKDMVHYMTEAPFYNPQPYVTKDAKTTTGAYEYLEWQIGVKPSEDFVFDDSIINPANVDAGLNKTLYDFLDDKAKALNVNTSLAPIAVSTRSDASGQFANNKFSSLPGLVSCVRRDHANAGPVRTAIVPNCHVRYLRMAADPSGQKTTMTIQYIDVIERGVKKTLTIAPHTQVVLAGSCIESTRLALESFSLVSAGLLPAGQELMGNNLHTHHRFDFTFRFNRTFLDDYLKAKGLKATLSRLLQVTALHVEGNRQANKMAYQYQLFAASNTLSGDFNQNQSPDDLLYKLVPNLDLARFIADHQDNAQVTLILRASGEMATNRSTRRNANDNWVDLAGPADYDYTNDHKRAWVNWGDHDNDEIWQTMYTQAVNISKLFGPSVTYWNFENNFWDTNPPSPRSIFTQQGLGTTYHDSGCLWMGENPVTSINKGEKSEVSVLDSGGHFHHVTNAYCCDQAAFPTCSVANPVPTGLVVARKVAADIFGRHSNLYNHYEADLPADKFVPLIASADAFKTDWSFTGKGDFTLQADQTYFGQPDWLIDSTGANYISGYIMYTKKQFKDVELRLEWKSFRVNPGEQLPVAGIFFNSSSTEVGGDGYEDKIVLIPINQAAKREIPGQPPTYGDSLYKTGSVSGVSPAIRWMAKAEAPYNYDGYWNEFRITIKGGKVHILLNNKLVVDNATLPNSKNASGCLGLKINTGHVQFRNIRAKDL